VPRARRVRVACLDHRGEPHTLDAVGWHARILQHEIDHLNGILFINHLSALKRDIIRRKIKKLIKAGEWD
jgi:peptide deformylase